MKKKESEKHFSAFQLEFIQVIIHLMETVLSINHKVRFTVDLDHFLTYSINPLTKNEHLGACHRESALIWLNERDLHDEPLSTLANVIIHEILHVAFPHKSEGWIDAFAHKYMYSLTVDYDKIKTCPYKSDNKKKK
jgi:hypothetical protein